MEDANKQAGEELARVQVLNAVITDATRSQSDRGKASKELSDILKDLNINMSKEAILNGQVGEATRQATQAILERAKARAIENRIGELSGEQLQRDLKREAIAQKLSESQKKLNEQLKIQKERISSTSTLSGFSPTIGPLSKTVNDLTGDIADLDKETSKANSEIKALLRTVTNQDLNVDFKAGAKDKAAVDVLKQRIAALKELQSLSGLDAKQQVELVQLEIKLVNRDGVKLGFSPAEIKEQADAILEKAFPVKTFEYETVVNTRVNKLEFSVVKDAAAITEGFKTDIAKALGIGDTIEIPAPKIQFTAVKSQADIALADLNKAINQTITDTMLNIGATVGEALGNAVAEGANVGDVFKNIGLILGEGLVQIGKALLAYGVALLAFDIAVKNLKPVVALAGGILAIAAGQAIKASIPKFADGGIVNKATLGIFGERGPEAIMPLSKIPKIFGEMNSNQPNVIINGNLRVSGTDLELALERVKSRRSRLG